MTLCPICSRPITADNPLGEQDDVIACRLCHTPPAADPPPAPSTTESDVCLTHMPPCTRGPNGEWIAALMVGQAPATVLMLNTKDWNVRAVDKETNPSTTPDRPPVSQEVQVINELARIIDEAIRVVGTDAANVAVYATDRVLEDRHRTLVEMAVADLVRSGRLDAGPFCHTCGLPLPVGFQGCIATVRPHARVANYHPFIPYFDFALGEQVDSLAQRWQFMKPQYDGEGYQTRERLEYREKMSKGDLSARHDRVHEDLVRKARDRRG